MSGWDLCQYREEGKGPAVCIGMGYPWAPSFEPGPRPSQISSLLCNAKAGNYLLNSQ